MQLKTATAIERSTKLVNDMEIIGAEANVNLAAQTEQIKQTHTQVDEINAGLISADKKVGSPSLSPSFCVSQCPLLPQFLFPLRPIHVRLPLFSPLLSPAYYIYIYCIYILPPRTHSSTILMHDCVSAPTDTRHRTTTGDRQIDSVHDAGDRMLGGCGYRDAVHGKSRSVFVSCSLSVSVSVPVCDARRHHYCGSI